MNKITSETITENKPKISQSTSISFHPIQTEFAAQKVFRMVDEPNEKVLLAYHSLKH